MTPHLEAIELPSAWPVGPGTQVNVAGKLQAVHQSMTRIDEGGGCQGAANKIQTLEEPPREGDAQRHIALTPWQLSGSLRAGWVGPWGDAAGTYVTV